MPKKAPAAPAKARTRAKAAQTGPARALFDLRWRRAARDLKGPLVRLYGASHDADALMARVRDLALTHWRARPKDLRALDLARDVDPDWFLGQEMVAYVLYVDRFAGTLAGLPARLPYLKDLGVTYVHLMPCLQPRPGPSDGGYAVMDYREIDPRLGTMDEFEAVARAFRAEQPLVCQGGALINM